MFFRWKDKSKSDFCNQTGNLQSFLIEEIIFLTACLRSFESDDSTEWSKSRDTEKNLNILTLVQSKELIFCLIVDEYLKFLWLWVNLVNDFERYHIQPKYRNFYFFLFRRKSLVFKHFTFCEFFTFLFVAIVHYRFNDFFTETFWPERSQTEVRFSNTNKMKSLKR